MNVRVAFDNYHGDWDPDDPLLQHLDHTITVNGMVFTSQSLDPATIDKTAFAVPEHRALYSHWSDLPRQDGLPLTAGLDPLSFREALGSVVLVEPNEDASDFRYRLFGTRMVEILGRDLTGTWNSEHPIAPAQAFELQYQAVIALRRCIYSENDAHDEISKTIRWSRLIMPMVAEDGTVNRLLVGTVPTKKKSYRDLLDR